MAIRISRTSAIKLGSFAGITAVAGACHRLGLESHLREARRIIASKRKPARKRRGI